MTAYGMAATASRRVEQEQLAQGAATAGANPGARAVDYQPPLVPIARGNLSACHVRPSGPQPQRELAATRRGLADEAIVTSSGGPRRPKHVIGRHASRVHVRRDERRGGSSHRRQLHPVTGPGPGDPGVQRHPRLPRPPPRAAAVAPKPADEPPDPMAPTSPETRGPGRDPAAGGGLGALRRASPPRRTAGQQGAEGRPDLALPDDRRPSRPPPSSHGPSWRGAVQVSRANWRRRGPRSRARGDAYGPARRRGPARPRQRGDRPPRQTTEVRSPRRSPSLRREPLAVLCLSTGVLGPGPGARWSPGSRPTRRVGYRRRTTARGRPRSAPHDRPTARRRPRPPACRAPTGAR